MRSWGLWVGCLCLMACNEVDQNLGMHRDAADLGVTPPDIGAPDVSSFDAGRDAPGPDVIARDEGADVAMTLDGGDDSSLPDADDSSLPDAPSDLAETASPDADDSGALDATTDTATDAATDTSTDTTTDARVCSPDSRECVGLTRTRVCATDGSAWAEFACSASESCSGGACRTRVCAPGAVDCADPSNRRTCNPDGLAYTTVACASTERCAMGMCLPTVCSPGAASCVSATERRVCNSDGSGFTTLSCISMQGCRLGVCAPWTCTPGAASCASVTARSVCDADGFTTTVTACPVPPHATSARCDVGVCSFVCESGYAPSGGGCLMGTSGALAAPRPLAPLSGSVMTSQRPALRWSLATGTDGARVQVCRDRLCTVVEQTLDATGGRAVPTVSLTAGVHFWRLFGRSGAVTGTTASVVWEFFVGARSTLLDGISGHVLDFDANGYTDVVVGTRSGGSMAFRGASSGVSTTGTLLFTPGSGAESTVAGIGDVNGDGFGDVAVGETDSNRIAVFLGGSSGLGTSASFVTGPAGSSFGHAVDGAGDVDGDGYADVIVGAYAGTSGHAYLYRGSPDGLLSAAATTLPSAGGAGFYGISVAGVGDVNADGYSDVLIGSLFERRAYLHLGGASGLSNFSSARLEGTDPGDSGFGNTVSGAGDVNGDGYADMLIGTTYPSGATGRAYVFRGAATGVEATPTVLILAGSSDNSFGTGTAGAGDLNADGYDDVAVGAIAEGAGTQGRVHVFLGSATGFSAVAPLVAPVTGQFGFALAGMGDTNGDGYDDLAVGAFFVRMGAGAVYLYRGNSSGVEATFSTELPPRSSDGRFGYSVAGR